MTYRVGQPYHHETGPHVIVTIHEVWDDQQMPGGQNYALVLHPVGEDGRVRDVTHSRHRDERWIPVYGTEVDLSPPATSWARIVRGSPY